MISPTLERVMVTVSEKSAFAVLVVTVWKRLTQTANARHRWPLLFALGQES
jgi:hypothetical protein